MTPFQAGGLTEDDARAAFKAWRFSKNDGEPICEACGLDAIYEYKTRVGVFKCKACGKQFSLTSGTPFAYKKLPYRKLMYLLTLMAQGKRGVSANSVFEDVGVQYKTAFAWFHKMRAAMKDAQSDIKLTGEIEVDGACWGGKQRPLNTKKTPRDLRRSTWRWRHLMMFVTVARQRYGGPVLTWVAHQEHWPASRILDKVEGEVLFYTDEGPWGALDKYPRNTVNHSETFCTEESCTNLAENFHSYLHYIYKTNQRIADRYLDFYAANAAWSLGLVGSRPAERFASLMQAMTRPGRSPMSGYFKRASQGGQKRLCEVVNEAGEIAGWRPPNKSERAALRAQAAVKRASTMQTRSDGLTAREIDRGVVSLKRSRSGGWKQGFAFLPAAELASGDRAIPDKPGVYALFVKGGTELLDRTSYVADPKAPIWVVDGRTHLYTGESRSLRGRLREHLKAIHGPSNLRDTLAALGWRGELPGLQIGTDRVASEEALSAWMRQNVVVGFKPCTYVKSVEEIILSEVASPLNIAGREGAAYARWLRDVRRCFESQVKTHWIDLPRSHMPVRR